MNKWDEWDDFHWLQVRNIAFRIGRIAELHGGRAVLQNETKKLAEEIGKLRSLVCASQVERYITAAQSELGPACEDDYVLELEAYLRAYRPDWREGCFPRY